MPPDFITNLPNVSVSLIHILGIKIPKAGFIAKLLAHPHYPSIYSLTETFASFKIPSSCYQLPAKDFLEMETPFVAYTEKQKDQSDFVLVTQIKDGAVYYIADKKKEKKESIDQFLKGYKEVVFAVDETGYNHETDELKKENKARLTKVLGVSGIGAILVALFYININPFTFITHFASLFILTLLGIGTTALLLIALFNKNHSLVQKFCAAFSPKDCSKVTDSQESTIAGISWSEIGFTYFAFYFLFLVNPGIAYPVKANLLSVISVLAAPFIFFSIYYQWKLKSACVLCNIVLGVLAATLIVNVLLNNWDWTFSSVSGSVLVSLILSLLIPAAGLYLSKPYLVKISDHDRYKFAYARLRNNSDVFDNFLKQQPKVPDGFQDMGITIGNPDARHTVLKICNPYCGPCAQAHIYLEELVKSNKIKLKIVFNATNEQSDITGTVSKHLLTLSRQLPADQFIQALDDWYHDEKKDYALFSKRYPVNGMIEAEALHLEQMRNWCMEAGLNFTPVLFVDGHKIPKTYGIEELKDIL